jgi:CubicO group peptidase (beta-lactamase class C family)
VTRRFRQFAAPLLAAIACHAAGQTVSPTGPDSALYGQAAGYPVPAPATPIDAIQPSQLVGFHSRYEEYRRLRAVPTSATPSPLKRELPELELSYEHNGQVSTIQDYLRRHPVTGLLVARGDAILFEQYQYARTDRHRMLSHSMAKTVLGLLVGAALEDGSIASLEDPVEKYVHELQGTEFGITSIRALLLMSSGISFAEDYRPDDDVSRLAKGLMGPGAPGSLQTVRQFNQRLAAAGTRFNYSSADSQVLGMVLRQAVGMPLTDYLSKRIWMPLGAEADAGWQVDTTGQELTFCCMVARLRDWARLGLMVAHDGRWNGQQVVARQWLYEMAKPDRARNSHYGYQTWVVDESRGQIEMRGILGQFVLVDPVTRLVLVQTAVQRQANDARADAELHALWRALIEKQGLTR